MRRLIAFVAAVLLVLIAAAVFQYTRPIPAVQPAVTLTTNQPSPSSPYLPWPTVGEAAVALAGSGELGAYGYAIPRPIASVAKLMTALVVLQDHPLAPGQKGDSITVSDADKSATDAAAAEGQSVVKVEAGEHLTEYELLQGLLIPSGNNLATMLARWDAGDVAGFVARMNSRARSLGMRQTHFDDPSGFSDRTVSTSRDLLRLAAEALASPVVVEIAAQPQAELPVAGTVYNVDYALGRSGISGLKTGSSPGAAACFVFSAQVAIGALRVTVIGAVMAQPTLDDAFAVSERLIGAARDGLTIERIITAGQPVGFYQAPWGSRAQAVAANEVQLPVWHGRKPRLQPRLDTVQAPLAAGSRVGSLAVGDLPAQQVPVTTDRPIFQPGRLWRLTRLA